jgi:hypothetical protein
MEGITAGSDGFRAVAARNAAEPPDRAPRR